MTKEFRTKIIGIAAAVACTVTTLAAVSSFCVGAANSDASAQTNKNISAEYDQEATQPTIDWEPGVYPVDADHFIIVYKDHTFRLMHGEPPTTRPWTIA